MFKRFLTSLFLIIFLAGCNSSNLEKSSETESLKTNDYIERESSLVQPTTSNKPSDFVNTSLLSDYEIKQKGVTPIDAKIIKYTNASLTKSKKSNDKLIDIDEVFINSKKGWRAYWDKTTWTMDLLSTEDDGISWTKIGHFLIKSANGIIFTNNNDGWITFDYTPAYGWVKILKTADGGKSWREQTLNAPDIYKDCTFYTNPPVFFSSTDGLILTHYYSEKKEKLDQLVYVTHDAGKSWAPITDKSSDDVLKWDCIKSDYGYEVNDVWQVSYNKKTWQSSDGITWELLKE